METLSDHRSIDFEIRNGEEPAEPAPRGWKIQRLDQEAFRISFQEQIEQLEEPDDKTLTEAIIKACDKSMPRKGGSKIRREVYWWTQEIATLRKECVKAGRKLVRRNRNNEQREETDAIQAEYRSAKKKLRDAIKTSKRTKWWKLCNEVDADTWGDGYRIIIKRMGNRPPALSMKMVRRTVNALFPEREINQWEKPEVHEVEPFSREELIRASEKLKSRKAPGPNEIPPEIIKKKHRVNPNPNPSYVGLRLTLIPVTWG